MSDASRLHDMDQMEFTGRLAIRPGASPGQTW